MNATHETGGMPDTFDRLIGGLDGLPDVVSTKPTPVRTLVPLLGSAQTFLVQTYRQREQGDTIFLECVSAEGTFRLAIPPKVADVIARQREALVAKARSKAAKANAQGRKDRGESPAFLKRKKR
jgi:hypothetical protein